MPVTRQQVGQVLREAREAKGLTLRKAAELLAIDKGYLSKIERGLTPVGKHASAIAKLYGLKVAEVKALATETKHLPQYGMYLRVMYDLADEDIAELEEHFKEIKKRPRKSRVSS